MTHARISIAMMVTVALAAGCATERQTQTAIGTGAGAATGAVVGGAMGGGRGASIGAVLGGGVGAAAGYNWDLIKEKLGMATKDTGVQVSQQNDGALKVNVPGSISFATGSAEITPSMLPTLEKIGSTLSQYPDTTVAVTGHTDSVGSTKANEDLSRRRAAAVADYLSQHGVKRERLLIEGRGELEPVSDNTTDAGRAQNRRVEMLIRPTKT